MAEEEAGKLRILECEQLLETLKDAADDAHARVEDANQQIGQILSLFDHQEIQVDLRRKNFKPSSHHFTGSEWSCPIHSQLEAKSWADSHPATSESCSRSATDDSDGDLGDSGNEH